MPIRRRQELLRWAEARNAVVIEDDTTANSAFPAAHPHPAEHRPRGGRVAYLNTFSQTIAPSMRVGFLVLPPRLLERWRAELGFYACTVPATEQAVLARFLAGGQYEQHLARMRSEYRLRRTAVLDAFRKSPFAGRIAITERGAGLHFLLRLDTARTDAELAARAEALGVHLGFLSDYCASAPEPACAHTLVVNYAGLEPERLPQAIDLLARVFAP